MERGFYGKECIYLITFLTIVITKLTYAKLPYGAPCTDNSQCQDTGGSLAGPLADTHTVCENGRCECSISQIRLFENNNYVCKHNLWADHENIKCDIDEPSTCVNGVCQEGALQTQCICNEGFVMSGGTCREVLPVKHSENCSTPDSGPVPICDYSKSMHCSDKGKCGCISEHLYDKVDELCITKDDYIMKYPEETVVGLNETCGDSSGFLPKLCKKEENMFCGEDKLCGCTKEFYPIWSNKTCASKKSWAKARNLTEYRAIPAEYCFEVGDCVPGLDCFKKTCTCPYPCLFVNATSSCDCGPVSPLEGASPAILIGVIGGLLIVAFWGYWIKYIFVIANEKPKENNAPPRTGRDAPIVPLREPYRIKSSTTGSFAPTKNILNDRPGLAAPVSRPTSQPQPPNVMPPPVSVSDPTPSSVSKDGPATDVSPAPAYGSPTTDPAPGGAAAASDQPPPYSLTPDTDASAPPPAVPDIYKPIIS